MSRTATILHDFSVVGHGMRGVRILKKIKDCLLISDWWKHFKIPKFNSLPLKNDGWKTSLSCWDGKSSGAKGWTSWEYFTHFVVWCYLCTFRSRFDDFPNVLNNLQWSTFKHSRTRWLQGYSVSIVYPSLHFGEKDPIWPIFFSG